MGTNSARRGWSGGSDLVVQVIHMLGSTGRPRSISDPLSGSGAPWAVEDNAAHHRHGTLARA